MFKLQKAVIVQCDVQKDDECWEEMVLSLEPEETPDEAIKFLKEMGWKFSVPFYTNEEEITIQCPGCHKGKRKPESDLYLVDGEEDN